MRTLPWKWFVLVAMIHVVLCVVLVGEPWLTQCMQGERESITRVLGEEPAQQAAARATDWYTRAFVNTGMVAATFSFTSGQREPKALAAETRFGDDFQRSTTTLMPYAEKRVRVMWTLLYCALLRIAYGLVWVPLGAAIVLAALLDGWARRKVKQTNFGLASADRFGFGVLGIELTVVGGIMSLFAPLTMPAWAPIGVWGLLALSLLVATSNLPKRL